MPAASPHRLRFILILGALSAFGPLSIDMYLPAFPRIAADFGVTVSTVELSLSAFFIGLSLGQLFYGPAADRFGRKPPLLVGLTIYVLASIGCAFAPSIEWLIALRFLQALGSCAGMVISRAVVRDLFDARESARVFSLLLLVMGLAPILAPLFGGWLIGVGSWHGIFAVAAVFAATVAAVVTVGLPETRGPDPDYRWGRVFHVYFDLLRDPGFVRYAVAGGLAQAGLFAYITGSPFVFIELFGIAPRHYGWFFGLNAVGLIGLSQWNGRLLKTTTPERILRWSSPLLAAVGAALAVLGAAGATMIPVLGALFFYMAVMGMIFPNTTALALAMQGHRAGAASALLGALQFVAATTASMVVSASHATSAFPMAATVGACGALSFLILPRSRRS